MGLQGLEPLGSASFPLDAGSMGEPFVSQGVLELKDGQGSIGLRWAWLPAGLRAGGAEAAPLLPAPLLPRPLLCGTLTVSIISASGLENVDWAEQKKHIVKYC